MTINARRLLLEMYARETDKLSVEFVDPNVEARSRKSMIFSWTGTTVFESGGVREYITTVDETEVYQRGSESGSR